MLYTKLSTERIISNHKKKTLASTSVLNSVPNKKGTLSNTHTELWNTVGPICRLVTAADRHAQHSKVIVNHYCQSDAQTFTSF